MSDLITSQMLSDWRTNYGLDKRTPIKAMHWWQDNMDGMAPAGVVAALGLCINEIERLTAALRHEADCVEAAKAEIERLQIGIELFDAADADLRTKLDAANDLAEMIASERDDLRRQLDECSQMLARQAATIRELTRPAEES